MYVYKLFRTFGIAVIAVQKLRRFCGNSLPLLLIIPAGISLYFGQDSETHVVTQVMRGFRVIGISSAGFMILLVIVVALLQYYFVLVLSIIGIVISILNAMVLLRWFNHRGDFSESIFT